MSQSATSSDSVIVPPATTARVGWAGFGLAPAVVAALVCVNLLLASDLCLAAVGKTWGGFGFNYYYLISRISSEHPIAAADSAASDELAFHRGDTLRQVNGQPPSNFAAAVTGRNDATYILQRGDQLVKVTGPLTTFGLFDFFGFYGLDLAVGWLLFALGVGIYVLRPDDAAGRSYMLTFTLAAAAIQINIVSVYVEGVRWLSLAWFEPVFPLLLSFLGAASFQLASIFPAPKPIVLRHPRLPLLGYAVALLLSAIYVPIAIGRIAAAGQGQVFTGSAPNHLFAYVFTSLGLLSIIFGLIWDWRRGDERVRRQARIVLVGGAVGIAPLVLLTIIPAVLVGQPIITVSAATTTLLAFPISIAYAIIRFRLFDLNFALRRAIVYLIASVIVAIIYFAAVALLHALFTSLTAQSDTLVLVFAAIAIAIIFNPLRQRLQKVVETFFFRERFVFRQTMLQFGQRVREAHTLDQLALLLVGEVAGVIDLTDAAVYAAPRGDAELATLRLISTAGVRPARFSWRNLRFRGVAEVLQVHAAWASQLRLPSVVSQWLLANPRPQPLAAVPREAAFSQLRESGSAMLAPLVAEGRLVGLLLMGAKRNGEGMLPEDRELLTALLPQVALAMRNAQFATIQSVLDELELLYATSRRISAAFDADAVIVAYLEQVAARGRYSCNIVQYDFDEHGERSAVMVRGLWRPDTGLVQIGERFPISRDALDPPLDAGQTVMISDVNTDPRVPDSLREMQRQQGYPALAMIPLMSGERRIGLVILSYPHPHDWREDDLQPYLATAAQLAVALANRQQQQLLNQRGQQLAVLEERQRLARELHDSVTQLIFSITLIAQSISPAWRRDPAEGEHRVARLLELSRTALTEMRALLAELRPTTAPPEPESGQVAGIVQVRRDGLPTALARHIHTLVRDDFAITLTADDYTKQPLEHEEAMYRITQEALNNIVKHAHAHHVYIELRSGDDGSHLCVRDDGVGFAPSQPHGMGMSTMRERAEALAGSTTVTSAPGSGTTVAVHLPRKEQPR